MNDQPVSAIRWLHLTDLHMGRNNESQQTAIGSLLSAVINQAGSVAFDLVLFTGDIANSGQDDEYRQVESQLISPLRQNNLFKDAIFLAVPGNHDLDCDTELPIAWKEIGRQRQEKFFYLGAHGKRTRGSRAKGFDQYSQFVKRAAIKSVDPLEQPAELFSLTVKGRQISIICVNTAFFSDKDVSDYQRSPAPVHPIRSLIQRHSSTDQVILLGHHPSDWFIPETEHHLYSLLVENNVLYLHGHEHRVRSKFSSRGLTYLGFGAAYQASSEADPNPYYRNSFAICELTESLHVAIFSWDAEHGQWRPEQSLPVDFVDKSPSLQGGFLIDLGRTRLLERGSHPGTVAAAVRRELHIEKCIWLVENHSKRWADLLCTIGALRSASDIYNLPTRALPPGHVQFRVKNEFSICLVYAVSGHGDILNYEQLQSINTELDRQEYGSCIVATLGELSADAKTLATQLATRKNILVLERREIVRRALGGVTGRLEQAIRRATEANIYDGTLIITETGLALILRDRRPSESAFQVVSEDGAIAPESSPIVVNVRRELSSLRLARYSGENLQAASLPIGEGTVDAQFDRLDYLQKTYQYFNNVKYAPLAALGFRFRNASLKDIYVDASADVGSSKSSSQLTRALSEFVESLNLPKSQQDQLESQLKSQYAGSRTSEVGAARKLYQRYNNVVVLGDPGSGKTCFVQHEILAYADQEPEASGWYKEHLPIYVSLSEAARIFDVQTPLVKIAEIVSARRGISLPYAVIEQAINDGRAAFFFDGLDEVGFLDKRIALVAQIRELVEATAHRGNRFVVASRPAAIQPVELPHALTPLQLKGLTEAEIKILSERVLTQRLGDVSSEGISTEEEELISRLLDDVKNVPGIARIARNPLLLTLLVLTYANTGALSTRRHVVYTQAVKTLVSVRGKYTREQQISESDLRLRLGAVALAIFRREIAEIPRRAEVMSVLAPLIARSGSARGGADATANFMQEVAEATGLLVIHANDAPSQDDLVSFMHYSFLEYYAAAGLLAGSFLENVPPLSSNPRWREVITLMVGMLSEQGDVTPLVSRIVEDSSSEGHISQVRTLLALDSAAECDVPPEATQEVLAAALYATMSEGAGKFSADLRVELARRLTDLMLGPNSILEEALCRGLASSDAVTAAAFADLVARLHIDVVLSPAVVAAFEACLDHESPVTRTAAIFAIGQRPELRSAKVNSIIKRSLDASVVEKHAALKAVASNPELSSTLMTDVRKRLDDTNPIVAAAAAQCMLVELLNKTDSDSESAVVQKALAKLNEAVEDEMPLAMRGITLDRDTVRSLILSEDASDSELAIRCVWLMKGDDQFVHEVLTQKLRTSASPRLQAASLDSLRQSPSAIDLITLADTDLICRLTKAENRNVRVAAVRLLADMPDDEQVITALQTYLKQSADTRSREVELSIGARALAKHVTRNPRLRVDALDRIIDSIPKSAADGFGNDAEQQHISALLAVCESIGATGDAFAWQLKGLSDDYKTPMHIRRDCIRVFGTLVEPSFRSVKTFVEWLSRDDTRTNDVVFASAAMYLNQCQKKVDYLRVVYPRLQELRTLLCEAWRREAGRVSDSISPISMRNIRQAVLVSSNLSMAYEEFSVSSA